jgi:hypothetical protein
MVSRPPIPFGRWASAQARLSLNNSFNLDCAMPSDMQYRKVVPLYTCADEKTDAQSIRG